MKIRVSALIFFLCFSAVAASAQNANIRGFVYFKESGEAAIFTSVYLVGTKYGASSDVNGYFSITRVPPGTYNLRVTYLGYDTINQSITVTKPNEIISKKLYLNKASVQLQEINVTAEQSVKETEVNISVNTVTTKEINKIPTVGGEPDLAQYLQVLPGVIFTGDQGGQLYIRGGSPIQNKVLLDGMIIYNPFHSIGLFSVFDADIIKNADIYTGGFNAEHGGRVSSIMDITTRDGNKKRLGGKVSSSTFLSKAILEGPIVKSKDPEQGSNSFILSAKHSYLPYTSKTLYPYADTAGLPFSFTDLYGKISLNAANGSKFNGFGFRFDDQVNYQAVSDLHWLASGGGGNFVLVPSASPILVQGNFAYTKYAISLVEELGPPRTSDIDGFNMGLDFTYFIGKSEVCYGLEVLGFKTVFDYYNSVNRRISQEQSTTEIAGFLKYKFVSKNTKLLIEPSFRGHYYASLDNFSPEPRLGMKYNATKKLRFKLASGIYAQNLISATSDRDVVNLFYGFLSGSTNIQETFTEQDGSVRDIKHYLQKANHLIIGAEYDISRFFDINLEVYQKNFTQLTNINRNKLFDDTPSNRDRPDVLKKDLIVETGIARGVDLLMKYDYKQLYVWLVYSLGFVTRYDGIQEYPPHFDRRHNVNFVASYVFGKDRNWESSIRWNLGSGFPFTPTQGFFGMIDFYENGISTDYTTENENLGTIYGDLNTRRLPPYHRLDLTVKRKIETGEFSTLEIAAGVSNAYNRANIFYFDRVQYKRVNQLPILPSLSASWTF